MTIRAILKSGCSLGLIFALASCGTLTGIPGHGGGKRFSEEQRLVSASIRGSLEAIDISSLRGKRVALVFSLISDEGAGNILGGRASLQALLTGASLISPVTVRSNALEIYQLASAGTSASTTSSTGSGTNSSTVTILGTTETETETEQTTEGYDTSTTTTTPESEVSTVFTTGTTETTEVTTTLESIITSETEIPDVTTTGTSTSTTNEDTTQETTGESESESSTDQEGTTAGTQEQVVTTGFTEQTSGNSQNLSASLNYQGLGTYQSISVPKSDASLLMSLTRNYFLLNDIEVTTPSDPTAELVVYVTVDIFGINRQRTDLVVYNRETLKAETAIEMFAVNKAGRIVMHPQVGNIQTSYEEEYIFWAGPLNTKRETETGVGLLNDFTDQGGEN